MIIPVKCFTCGKVIGNKYRYYLEQVREKKLAKGMNVDDIIYLTNSNSIEKEIEGSVLDIIGLTNSCCRLCFLTHVDIE